VVGWIRLQCRLNPDVLISRRDTLDPRQDTLNTSIDGIRVDYSKNVRKAVHSDFMPFVHPLRTTRHSLTIHKRPTAETLYQDFVDTIRRKTRGVAARLRFTGMARDGQGVSCHSFSCLPKRTALFQCHVRKNLLQVIYVLSILHRLRSMAQHIARPQMMVVFVPCLYTYLVRRDPHRGDEKNELQISFRSQS
jgi:hypothetical protein